MEFKKTFSLPIIFVFCGITCKLTNLYNRVDGKIERKGGIFIIIFSIRSLHKTFTIQMLWVVLKKNKPSILPRIIFPVFLLRPVLFLTHKI